MRVYRQTKVIYVYAHPKNGQDAGNTDYQTLYARASSLSSKANGAVSWFKPEVLQLSDDQIWQHLEEEPELEICRHYIQQIVDNRTHVLSAEQEPLPAGVSEIFDTSNSTFAVLNNADLVFPMIEGESGEAIQLFHGVYGQLLESTGRRMREAASKGSYSVYKQFRDTFASTLGTHIKGHNFKAKIHSYSSARETFLSSNHIPESVCNILVDVVNKHLPLLHRYVELRKRLLEVEKLHMYDPYIPVLGEAPIILTHEGTKERALEALKLVGEEYIAVVEKVFSERWIDVVESKGRRSGAYSSGGYDTNPHILLNWHDTLDQLFMLVHEMGHSAHSYFIHSNQPYVYGNCSTSLTEIALITNENIPAEYLLETEKDPRVRTHVLNHHSDGSRGTVLRQTQFAEFEYFIHTEDEKGVPLTDEYLSDSYDKLNAKHYGSAIEEDLEVKSEWSRILHFYHNYYILQYSTGFSTVSALAKKIPDQGPEALEDYSAHLEVGSNGYPMGVTKKAGVDMTQAAYIEDATSMFEQRLNELKELTDRL